MESIREFTQKTKNEEYITVNGWGFNGTVGKKYTLGTFKMIKGKYYYRHTGASLVLDYFIDEKLVSENDFLKAIKDI